MSKVFIEETTLSAIGDAIREKTGSSDLINPLDMPSVINSITTGETIEIPVITGKAMYRFAYNGWDWFVEAYGNQMRTENLTDVSYMFSECGLKAIPFDLNFDNSTYRNMAGMFNKSTSLREVPNMNNVYPSAINNLFESCDDLRYLPENFGADWNWDRLHTYNSAQGAAVFNACRSLRSIPISFLSNFYTPYYNSVYGMYYRLFNACYNLDEICGLQIMPKTLTSNIFNTTFENCYCLKRLTFITNEDGTPKTINWKSQVVDLSKYVGYYEETSSSATRDKYLYNSGRTIDKVIYNEETYTALKNDPDAYVFGYKSTNENPHNFSLYNHDSAVETINSLPDCSSSGGTNTIKFKGEAGALTDAGAINTMTQEEIAVATAKGWTVSFT